MMHEKVTVLPQGVHLPTAQRRTCVLVLGMHRSGTSALARVLSLLGCDLPKTLLGGDKSNEAGHWESEAIVRFNDRLLASAGTSWDDWLAFNPEWYLSPRVAQFHEEASNILEAEFGDSSFFVLKDPRICRLAPFWINVLAANGAAPRIVVPVRNPVEVASSLAARNGFEPAIGHLMWLRHVLEAEFATRGRPRFFTSYDGLLKNWTSVTAGASETLGFHWPRHAAQIDDEVVSFLDRNKRHHAEAIEDTLGTLRLSGWLRDAFRIFADWAKSGENPQDVASLDLIRKEFDASAPAFVDIVAFGRRAKRENARLQAEQISQVEEIQAGERTITELRTRLEQNDRNAAAHLDESRKVALAQAEKLQRLEAELDAARIREQEQGQVVVATQQSSVELSRKLAETERLLAGQRQKVDATASEITRLRDSASRSEEAFAEMREQLAGSDAALAEARKEKTAAEGRLAERLGEITILAEQLRDSEGALTEAHEQLAEGDAALTEARREKTTSEGRLAERFQEISALTGRLRDTEREITKARQQLVESGIALAEARREKSASERRLAGNIEEIAILTGRLRDAEWKTNEACEQLATKDAALESHFADIAELTDALRETGHGLHEAKREVAATREKVNRLEAGMADKKQELEREKREAESRLGERFAEIARLTKMVAEAEASSRKAESQRDWLRDTASVLVGGSRSWGGRLHSLLPAVWRRKRELVQLRKMGLFDAQRYFSANPDVASSTQDALRHYLRHGLTEDRVLDISSGGDATS